MTKNSKLLFTAIILLTLLTISAYATLISDVHAAGITLQQKGQTILDNVVGLDLTKYTTVIAEHPQDAYLGVLPKNYLQYTLQSNESTVNVAYTFVNGNLQSIHVLEGEGSPITTMSASTPIEMAKSFLTSYKSFSGDSFYDDLKSMLNNIDASKSLTTTVGNTKLDISRSGNSTTFRWTYTYEGIEAPVKCVALDYENGFLKYFIDNWNFYKIGSTSINLSEKEATDNGLTQAKNFSWKIGEGNKTHEFKDFNATQAMVWETIFSNGLSAQTARNHDPLTLYPLRHVWVSLDKFYPGNVYGIEVFLWADTKDVYSIEERFSTIDPPADFVANLNDTATTASSSLELLGPTRTDPLGISWIAIPTFTIVALGATLVFGKKKKLQTSRSLKIAALLCLAASSAVLLPVSNVFGANRSSLIWGSRSTGGADSTNNGDTWRKTSNELGNQSATAADINVSFGYYGGYIGAHNYQGTGSEKSQILTNITYSQNNYPFNAVIDFDHGIGENIDGYWHYRFEDDNGTLIGNYPGVPVDTPLNAVYDEEIHSNTGGWTNPSNVFFAFINTCMSANLTYQVQQPDGSAVGIPYAWTHKIVLSKNDPGFNTDYYMSLFGYNESDEGDYCYIGFPSGSAGLSQTSIQSGYTQTTYASWVQEFFAYALMYDYSIIDALDHASLMCFDRQFGGAEPTDLYKNFTAIWPYWNGDDWISDTSRSMATNCTLAVYGNGNMHLRAPELTVNALDSDGNPISADVYIDSQYRGTTGNSFRVTLNAYHTVQVTGAENAFHNFAGYSDFENPISVLVYFDTAVTANYYTNPPPEYKLTVSCGDGGTTSLSVGDHYYTPQSVPVTAYPNSGGALDYWVLDENQHTENPIHVPMNGDHTLQAYFRQAQITVYTMTQAYNPVVSGVYLDDEYIDSTGQYGEPVIFTLPLGSHSLNVDSWIWDEYWQQYVFPLNVPMSLTVTGDIEITIYYTY